MFPENSENAVPENGVASHHLPMNGVASHHLHENTMAGRLPITHLLIALLVVAVWGCNFVFIHFALNEISPLLLCAMRFIVSCFPALFFVPFPKTSVYLVLCYGFILFGLQFSLLFLGMKAGMTPGLASLLIQMQVFFSIFFAVIFIGEMPKLSQIIGALVSFSGIGLILLHLDQSTTVLGFVFIIGAAASWGVGNLITKKIGKVNIISLVVWGSFFASFPLIAVAYLVEGKQSFIDSFHHLSWLGLSSLLYIVYASTWLGYGLWNWLITRHSVPTIVPFTLLVPIFGMLSSAIILGETFESWKAWSAMLVILGLLINIGIKKKGSSVITKTS